MSLLLLGMDHAIFVKHSRESCLHLKGGTWGLLPGDAKDYSYRATVCVGSRASHARIGWEDNLALGSWKSQPPQPGVFLIHTVGQLGWELRELMQNQFN